MYFKNTIEQNIYYIILINYLTFDIKNEREERESKQALLKVYNLKKESIFGEYHDLLKKSKCVFQLQRFLPLFKYKYIKQKRKVNNLNK